MKIIAGILLVFFLTSCGKSLEKTLVNNGWMIESITSNIAVDMNNDGSKSVDIKAQNPECMSDDVFILNSNNEMILDDAALVCEEPKLKKGSWSVEGERLSLTLPNTAPIYFDVNDYSEKKVVASTSFTMNGEKVTFTYIFVRR